MFSSLRISRKRSYSPLIPSGHGHVIVGLEPLAETKALPLDREEVAEEPARHLPAVKKAENLEAFK